MELSAQSSAVANASATITTPISIEKVSGKDLDFGNIAAGNSVGMVILNPTGVRQVLGGASLSSTAGTVSVAEFLVKGEASYSFSITLPAAVTLLNSNNNSQTMTVDSFTSTPEATGTLYGGATTLKIGARLTVNANQDPGYYVSDSPFSITVNYN